MVGMTDAHNAVRAAVDTSDPLPPLTWSSDLAAVAQAYADTLQTQGCDMVHSDTDYGENLYWSQGMSSTPEDVVGLWADEESCFVNAAYETCTCTCGHYSQIVWRDTLRVGCGMATCSGEIEIWVCNYDPSGNWVGEIPY
jgi:hypothetical protein